MWILPALGYVGLILGFAFLTLAIASGLYYLSELVEEHTVIAKKILTRLIYFVMAALTLLLLVDGFPWTWCALSIASHLVYLQNLRRFPTVKLTDPIFVVSCVLVLLNHYAWFRHFSSSTSTFPSSKPSYPYSRTSPYDDPYERHANFSEVASFFGLCVWLVPFALFVSLSASENVLPSMGSEYATGEGSSFISSGRTPVGVDGGVNGSLGGLPGVVSARSGKNSGLAKAVVDGVRGWVGETGQLMGFWREEGRARSHRF